MNTAKKMSRPIISKKKLSQLQGRGRDNVSSTISTQSDYVSNIPSQSMAETRKDVGEIKVLPLNSLINYENEMQYEKRQEKKKVKWI